MNCINERVKEIRKSYALTQVEFADRLGVTNAHISAIEKGKTTPSHALVKLICSVFKINEEWLRLGQGPIESEEIEIEIEDILIESSSRLNHARTRDNLPIRSRVAQIESLFSRIVDINVDEEQTHIQYLDICYKLFYHINSYLDFGKQSIEENQVQIFPYPNDVLDALKKDIDEFEELFNSTPNA